MDAIATAVSLEALADLQRLARSEQLFDPRGGFLELLFAVRYETLTSTQASPSARGPAVMTLLE